MPDYLLLMHDDPSEAPDNDAWAHYISTLQAAGVFQGGSAIGAGLCARKTGTPAPISNRLSGFIRITAENLAHAQTLLTGNPDFEAGGTVEIRELPRTD